MARISKYTRDTGLTDKDLLVGSNYISGSLGQETYETATFSLGAVKSYVGATEGAGAYTTFTRTFTGSELVDAFNGNAADEIILVSVPAGKIAIVIEATSIVKGASTGTTNYNASNNLYILPSGANTAWGARLSTTTLNNSFDYVSLSIDAGTGTSLSITGGTGADIVLSGGSGVNISQGDREVVLSIVYRLIDF